MAIPRRLWSLREERPRFVALCALTVAVLVVWPVVDFYLREAGIGIPYGFNDWGVYTGTIEQWEQNGRLYVENEDGGYHGSYLYPPITLLVFYPFASFEFTTGAILFGGLSLFLLWLGVDAVAGELGCELGVLDRIGLLVALFGFQPALRDFKWAQVSTLLAALLCFAFYAYVTDGDRNHSYLSGVLTTVGSGFKLFIATAGAHLLRDRDRFVGGMATAAVMAVASVLVFGVEPHLQYVDVLRWGKGWGGLGAIYVWDTSAAYKPLYFLSSLGLLARVLGVLGVVGLVLAARDDESTAVRHATFALGVAVAPFFAPQAAAHDLVIVVLPAVVLLAVELDRPGGYPSVPVLAVLGFHFHRYAVELVVAPAYEFLTQVAWLPHTAFEPVPHLNLASWLAAWLQPGLWATFLLVGLAAYRVAEGADLRVPSR